MSLNRYGLHKAVGAQEYYFSTWVSSRSRYTPALLQSGDLQLLIKLHGRLAHTHEFKLIYIYVSLSVFIHVNYALYSNIRLINYTGTAPSVY